MDVKVGDNNGCMCDSNVSSSIGLFPRCLPCCAPAHTPQAKSLQAKSLRALVFPVAADPPDNTQPGGADGYHQLSHSLGDIRSKNKRLVYDILLSMVVRWDTGFRDALFRCVCGRVIGEQVGRWAGVCVVGGSGVLG